MADSGKPGGAEDGHCEIKARADRERNNASKGMRAVQVGGYREIALWPGGRGAEHVACPTSCSRRRNCADKCCGVNGDDGVFETRDVCRVYRMLVSALVQNCSYFTHDGLFKWIRLQSYRLRAILTESRFAEFARVFGINGSI